MRQNLCQSILAIILIAGALAAGAREDSAQAVPIPTSTAKADYYPWITFLSEGPIDWFAKDESAPVQGRAYRLVITTSEIYNTVYIEMVTLGGEGCCKKLKSVRKFDLDTFCKAFNFIGEQAGFELVEWLNETSLVFRYQERDFVMSDIGKERVRVAPYSGG